MRDEVYTHGHHASVLRSHGSRTAADSCGYLLPHLRDDMQLLDVGCGPGSITADLARHLPRGRVVGLENVAAPLHESRRRANDLGGVDAAWSSAGDEPARVPPVFVTGDVYELPFADGSFDVVHAHQVLQHLVDPVSALREMARVCRPDGLVAVRDADYSAFALHPLTEGLALWQDLYHRLARSNRAEPDAGRRLRSWAVAAGLEDLTCSSSTWTYASPEDVSWWGDMWAERALESAFARQALDRGLATSGELQAISRSWHEWGRHPEAWLTVVHGEVLARPSA